MLDVTLTVAYFLFAFLDTLALIVLPFVSLAVYLIVLDFPAAITTFLATVNLALLFAGFFVGAVVGAVVGATYPEQAEVLRRVMPHTYFLVPGYGAQGGKAEDVAKSFNGDGLGAIVNASRSIMCAYKKNGGEVGQAARDEAIRMRDDIMSAVGAV